MAGSVGKFIKRVKQTINKYDLLEKGDKVLIAYSGGADSSALIALLYELRKELGIELFLGHFNHNLRKKTDEEEQFARRIALEYSIPIFVGSDDVRSYAKSNRLNLEEAARKLRYSFLKKKAFDIGGAKIATGHTMTDQAETFLMRLMRGSGHQGLASIFPMIEGTIIRPMIELERKDIEVYLAEKGLEFCVDESNFDHRFLRNRIRWELVPFIQEKFEPKIIPSIGRIVSILQEEESLLEKITTQKAQKTILHENNHIRLDLNAVLALPHSLSRRLVREFILKLKGNLRGISFEDIESVLNLSEGKKCHMKKNLFLKRENGYVFLEKEQPQRIEYEYLWNGKEALKVRELHIKLEAKRSKKTQSKYLDFNDKAKAFLNLEKLKFPLLVRNRRKGDRYQPLGAPGRKKLKEIMRAKRIPLSERKKNPVLLSRNEIVWVQSLPVSEKFKIDRGTREIFIVSVVPSDDL